MKLYELTYLPLPGLSEDEQKILLEGVVSALGIQPVSQQSSGFLTTLDFNSAPEKIKEIDEKLKQERQIRKYIILKKVISRFKARISRRIEFSARHERKTETFVPSSGRGKPKVELQEIEKKLDEILKD